jgi:hypothetical protein
MLGRLFTVLSALSLPLCAAAGGRDGFGSMRRKFFVGAAKPSAVCDIAGLLGYHRRAWRARNGSRSCA